MRIRRLLALVVMSAGLLLGCGSSDEPRQILADAVRASDSSAQWIDEVTAAIASASNTDIETAIAVDEQQCAEADDPAGFAPKDDDLDGIDDRLVAALAISPEIAFAAMTARGHSCPAVIADHDELMELADRICPAGDGGVEAVRSAIEASVDQLPSRYDIDDLGFEAARWCGLPVSDLVAEALS